MQGRNRHLLITNSTRPAQPIRFPGEGHGDRYLRHGDIPRTYGIGERIGAKYNRIGHDSGVGQQDEQLAKGEAGRDAKVERVRDRRMHDRPPARHARRGASGRRHMPAREARSCDLGDDESRGGERAWLCLPDASSAHIFPTGASCREHDLVLARADGTHRLGASNCG